MYSNVVVIEGKFLPPELFDIDREDITMNSKMQAAVDRAKSEGWKVNHVKREDGGAEFALVNPAGTIVLYGTTEEKAWQHAFNSRRDFRETETSTAQESGHDRRRKQNPAG